MPKHELQKYISRSEVEKTQRRLKGLLIRWLMSRFKLMRKHFSKLLNIDSSDTIIEDNEIAPMALPFHYKIMRKLE